MMTATLGYVKGSCWRIWDTYFSTIENPTPPLTFLKPGSTDNEGWFVCPVSETVVDDFIKSTHNNPEMEFRKLSEWALNSLDWFGEWTVLVCRPRVSSHTFQRTGKRK